MEQRKYPRVKTRIVAKVNDSQALLENVSKQGIKMKLWSEAVPQTPEVEVAFTVGKQRIKINGSVRWCRRAKYSFQDLKEMGLYLENPPQDYIELIDSLSTSGESALHI